MAMRPDPPTLVLPGRYTEDTIAIGRAAGEAGWAVERLASWRVPEALADVPELVFYGEPLFAEVVAPQLGVELLEPAPDFLPRLPERHRLRAVRLTTVGQARRAAVPTFVKPGDGKSFDAAVYASGADLPGPELAPDDAPALVSDPVEWTVEWRCFVLDGAVVTASPYLRDGAIARAEDGTWPAPSDEERAALAFAATVLDDTEAGVAAAVVIDVGRIAGSGWAVVEANSAWGSGIYGCDPAAILPVLRRACSTADR